MKPVDRAFIRGFCAAVAEMERHHVNAEDLLRDISATAKLLKQAAVDEFDLADLRPVLSRMRARQRQSSRSKNYLTSQFKRRAEKP